MFEIDTLIERQSIVKIKYKVKIVDNNWKHFRNSIRNNQFDVNLQPSDLLKGEGTNLLALGVLGLVILVGLL